MPSAYFDKMTNVIAVPDYTCTYQPTDVYFETPQGGEYFCFCDGNSYNGLPSFTFTYYNLKTEYTMDAKDYLFDPYLNYTSGMTRCILSLAGPTKEQYNVYNNAHVLILGQRFFANFPISVVVDRAKGTYSLTIGGAKDSTHDSELLIVIFVAMAITVILLLILIYKMIQIRSKRIEADLWLNENQEKLVKYALFVKPEETGQITNVLE